MRGALGSLTPTSKSSPAWVSIFGWSPMATVYSWCSIPKGWLFRQQTHIGVVQLNFRPLGGLNNTFQAHLRRVFLGRGDVCKGEMGSMLRIIDRSQGQYNLFFGRTWGNRVGDIDFVGTWRTNIQNWGPIILSLHMEDCQIRWSEGQYQF